MRSMRWLSFMDEVVGDGGRGGGILWIPGL